MSGDHWSYVLLSYGAALLIVGGMAARILFEHRRLKAELARLETLGAPDEGDTT